MRLFVSKYQVNAVSQNHILIVVEQTFSHITFRNLIADRLRQVAELDLCDVAFHFKHFALNRHINPCDNLLVCSVCSVPNRILVSCQNHTQHPISDRGQKAAYRVDFLGNLFKFVY